jgi:GTP-binding protein HflX
MDRRSLLHSDRKDFQFALLVGTYEGTPLKPQCEEQLEELKSLAETFHLITVHQIAAPLRGIDAGTFLGKGKVEEIKQLVETHKADVVIFDDLISPQQQKNLEEFFGKPVIDRTELILGVFAERAQTKEAKLQIELASVRYQMPRLRHLWTHLSRQKTGGSGGGFLKGEGEKQIEIDRRILQKKLDQIRRELEEVKKHRETQRSSRGKSQIPTFAIIGYTNVGKSTLLNALTHANVLVEDKLFATLDTTTRKFILPNKQPILLIDTVGFIRKIPHELVAAFKSTLEEAVLADILLHLVDASHPSALIQAEATFEVLKELNASKRPIITVFNKIDQCKTPAEVDRLRFRFPKSVAISALNQTGFDRLFELMMKEISLLRKKCTLRIPQSQYQLMSEIREEGQVLSCEYEENDMIVEVEIPTKLEPKVAPFKLHES